MTYADIIVDISHEKLDKSFQYLVPEKLKDEIQVGMVVSIPFGSLSLLSVLKMIRKPQNPG